MSNDRRKKIVDMITPLIAKEMTRAGKILEGGWLSARAGMYKHITDEKTLVLMREAYMGGAQHLFSTVTQSLSDGNDINPEDEAMMESVVTELENWYSEMAEKYLGPASDPRPM